LRGVPSGVVCIAFGARLPKDPTRAITWFKTAWTQVRKNALVKGRRHDNRHPW
jgi:hypothetical protein